MAEQNAGQDINQLLKVRRNSLTHGDGLPFQTESAMAVANTLTRLSPYSFESLVIEV